MKADYKGHKNLADMVSTHIDVWREALTAMHEESTMPCDMSYYAHELKALSEIEAAIKAELGGVE